MLCGAMPTVQFLDDVDAELNPLMTGSVAEFYIEPMLPHIGDIDVMCHLNTQLAVPRRHPPPTQLPAEFHNYVKVYEIIDSHLPGYVYLELCYLLAEGTDDGSYNAAEYDGQRQCLGNQSYRFAGWTNIHGPAVTHATNGPGLSLDQVHCVRCLVWPPQAADWPARPRNYGWPDSATLGRVVSNGCDVVGVAHRQCRQHEWMGELQHRLSFSRAEIALINSWMPVQQIVYHMLRYFMKTERLTECADNSGTLSNYHIKTLMLWACELKPKNWWTDDVNLVRICVQLLYISGEWLTFGRYEHYFIKKCNLVDNSFNVTDIGGQLTSIDVTWLSTWFVDNYVRKCLQLTPYRISRLFDDVGTSTKLQNAVSALVAWKQRDLISDRLMLLNIEVFEIPMAVNARSLTARSCVCWRTELAKFDARLSVYFAP